MKTSVAKSGRSARIVTRLAPPFLLPSCRFRAGTSRLAIPPSLTASSTAWFTMPTASRCAESPCGRNAIRRRPRRKNEPKSISLSAKWRYYVNNRFADHTHPPPRWTGGFFVSSHPEAADVTDEGPPQNENRFWQRSGLLSSGMVCHGFVVKGSSKSVDCRNISFGFSASHCCPAVECQIPSCSATDSFRHSRREGGAAFRKHQKQSNLPG